MGIGRDAAVRRQLRTLFNVGVVRDLTDGQLLERFAVDRGEAAELAFAVLVERHGAMVMRVCRGVLADDHAAQDAFQATFLVLVKRARGLWVRDSIGPWLHQVAYRTATHARATAVRHRRLEQRAARDAHEARPERDFELERLLHEEIDRLPERFRSPVVLCDLEGRTHEQAARHLGWPVGTVKSRLSRARDRLRDRLIRRGVASEAGPMAVAGAIKTPGLSIPPTLVDATTATAVQFAAVGAVVRGSAVSLAEGVLRTMSMPQWWKVAAVLLVAGATASGVELLGSGSGPGAQVSAARKDQAVAAAPTREVRRGKLEFVRSSGGSVEAVRTEDVLCRVEGGTTIIKIVPEGQKVKKGEVIAELDSAALRDQLVDQGIKTKTSEANFLNAKLGREVAEIAVKEYREGILPQEIRDLDRAIEGSRAAIRRIEERMARTRRASEELGAIQKQTRGVRTSADVVAEVDIRDRIDAAESSRDRERRALARAEDRRDRLANFTGPKTIKELESEVMKILSQELARQATWRLERSKEHNLETQISRCTLIAPIDGTVVYPNDANLTRGGFGPIQEGATVRERERLVSIVDVASRMLINLRVPEPWVDQIRPKMKARIKVDAFTDLMLDGEVIDVAPRPDPVLFSARNIKIYPTRIRIDRGPSGLRPGMSAEAGIVIGERDDAIGVPVGAVVFYDGGYHAAVNRPDGRVEWRDVVLGASDDQIVEVKEGLREGDRVILDPAPLLTDEQRDRIKATTSAQKKAGTRKGRGITPPGR